MHEEITVKYIIFHSRQGKTLRKIAYQLNMGKARHLPKPRGGKFISPQTVMSVLRRFEHSAKYINVDDPTKI